MQENYLISIIGKQRYEEETGEIKLTTLGSYITKGNNRYIVYKEYDTDNANAAQTSILKIEGDETVTLMRGGASNTRLILQKGKRHLCQYNTGFGSMMVGIFTNSLKLNLDEKGGKVELSYTLDINSAVSSVNQISITVKEAGANQKVIEIEN